MPVVGAILAFIGLTPAPKPLPRRRRRPSGATPVNVPAPVAPTTVAPARPAASPLAFPSPLPAAKAVRVLQAAAGLPVQHDGLGGNGKTPADAREALGRDLAAYVDLCIVAGQPLPGQSIATERADDAAYRGRLRRACVSDLDLWERARSRRERERAEAAEDGRQEPPALYVPAAVVEALATRKAAREAERTARRGDRGSGTPPHGPRPAPPAGLQR
ncbi:hypothetical protein BHAOGJBA_0609 [Methylobacterium hispanicum]|uniref:Uncharacterized protein n=1 Tax=Methylobacterium hispanicum TaxID=270350 RepID=A0AAV4ZFE8_9HYPH|nr:hypothetical protein BHAOGJBA_0609 [Methylobacterium hispanicum]